jgi:hypothetical protein
LAHEVREIKREGSIDEKGVRRYIRTFQVITDDFTLGPGLVATLVPTLLYESYNLGTGEQDLFAILKKKDARPVEGQLGMWEVVCEYDSAPLDFGTQSGSGIGAGSSPGAGNNQVAPNLRPWVIKLGSNKTTKVLTKDLNNVEVVNSAGVPFDPPIEVPAAFPTISITAYKATFAFSQILTYTNAINSDAWQGFPPRRLRCIEYAATTQFENGAFFWQLDVTLEYNPDEDWNPVKVLDASTVWRESMTKPPAPIEVNGVAVTSPVPICNGVPVPAGGQPCYLDFTAYREVAFATII